MNLIARALVAPASLCLLGCMAETDHDASPQERVYGRNDILIIDADVVGIYAEMQGAADRGEAAGYAQCLAVGYAIGKGYGFVRHIRTNIQEEAGIWRADALYSISAGVPDGIARIDAEVTAADCTERSIPTS